MRLGQSLDSHTKLRIRQQTSLIFLKLLHCKARFLCLIDYDGFRSVVKYSASRIPRMEETGVFKRMWNDGLSVYNKKTSLIFLECFSQA